MERRSKLKRLIAWIDARFPLLQIWNAHLARYYAPKNFNFWYFFGSLALLVLVNQILTGIWLAMYYTPTATEAFASVEYIMRDVNFGWLLRYLHSTGASAFFLIVYFHMFRALLYGSHKNPRELVWLIGVAIYILLLAEAFMGYLLPWGQMSYWGAEVIVSLFSAVPVIGEGLATWIRGDYNISGVTLNRFYALHVAALPLLILLMVWMHIIALHKVGSNNPEGIDIKRHKDAQGHPRDGVPFHPYYTVKDLWGMAVFLFIFFVVVFFAPTLGGLVLEPVNFLPANSLQTPAEIHPLWYMTPYYAMLRAVPNKLLGVMVLQGGMAILFFIPWLDRSPVRSIRYRGIYSKLALGLFCVSFLSLIYLGLHAVSPLRTTLAQVFTVLYFSFFLLMPFYTRFEKTKPVPERVP
jgi:ubiquinol-cytochrome c reductase cytochrome b subunit